MKIHYSVYILLICALYTNSLVLMLLFLFSIIAHEIGHLLVLKIYKQKILKLNLSMFGGELCASIENLSFLRQLVVNLAGISVNLLICVIIGLLNNDSKLLNDLYLYNKILIIFNLLPIYPLDGYRIIEGLINHIFQKNQFFIITNISIVFLIILFIYGIYQESIALIIIFVVLGVKNIIRIKEKEKYLLMRLVKNMT